jgi:hypothetical protein
MLLDTLFLMKMQCILLQLVYGVGLPNRLSLKTTLAGGPDVERRAEL